MPPIWETRSAVFLLGGEAGEELDVFYWASRGMMVSGYQVALVQKIKMGRDIPWKP